MARASIPGPMISATLALLSASAAQASGQLPPMPIESRTFASFAACRAFLDATYRDDLGKADPTPLRRPDGSTGSGWSTARA